MRACVFTVPERGPWGRVYAVPIESVVEFFGAGELTPVPTAPPLLSGVVWRRGQVVPVLQLPGATTTVSSGQALLMLQQGELVATVPVERVLDLVDLDPAAASPLPDAPAWVRARFEATGTRPHEILLIDVEALMHHWRTAMEAAA
ncbi:MAG: chemotaxis protein CheW [Deltaproteobacteria bacterium]|nr:MAG: chemotaxis protein CheW [Deltaproteobacteria bacterium]